LKTFAEEVKATADQLRPGPEKDLLLRKRREADTAAHLEEWANSPDFSRPSSQLLFSENLGIKNGVDF
jgi:hypothetical protein